MGLYTGPLASYYLTKSGQRKLCDRATYIVSWKSQMGSSIAPGGLNLELEAFPLGQL